MTAWRKPQEAGFQIPRAPPQRATFHRKSHSKASKGRLNPTQHMATHQVLLNGKVSQHTRLDRVDAATFLHLSHKSPQLGSLHLHWNPQPVGLPEPRSQAKQRRSKSKKELIDPGNQQLVQCSSSLSVQRFAEEVAKSEQPSPLILLCVRCGQQWKRLWRASKPVKFLFDFRDNLKSWKSFELASAITGLILGMCHPTH